MIMKILSVCVCKRERQRERKYEYILYDNRSYLLSDEIIMGFFCFFICLEFQIL